jgi:Ca2+-binding RTX toxin-like protein
MRRFSFMSAIAIVALVIIPQSAAAATTLGEVFDPTAGGVCTPAPRTFLQTAPAQYVAPSGGVITSWSYQAAASPLRLKLKVGRALGGTQFLIVGESAVEIPTANHLNTYPTRIPVNGGDVLGFTMTSNGQCFRAAGPNFVYQDEFSDPAPGTSPTFTTYAGLQFDVSALLEPDCDKDGLGDETQDTKLSACGTNPLSCKGQRLTIVGTPGNDEIVGTTSRDVISTLGGNDKASGLGANDLICGGPGKDKLKGGPGNDTLLGQGGNDALKGGGASDTCKGGKGKDSLSSC